MPRKPTPRKSTTVTRHKAPFSVQPETPWDYFERLLKLGHHPNQEMKQQIVSMLRCPGHQRVPQRIREYVAYLIDESLEGTLLEEEGLLTKQVKDKKGIPKTQLKPNAHALTPTEKRAREEWWHRQVKGYMADGLRVADAIERTVKNSYWPTNYSYVEKAYYAVNKAFRPRSPK
ncbi:MAG: hypothetical protein R3B95_19235 [Nitrospirales bacterium]|nr:hypothetical protein [Nitrospirales bacterium]